MKKWTAPYHASRRRPLVAQIALLVVAEPVLFAAYREYEASVHWAIHLLVATTTWSLANLAWLMLRGAPARGQPLTLLGWHLVAVFPDLLAVAAGVPHRAWMNVFLAHVSSDRVPGGAYSRLIPAVIATGLYGAVLAGWLRARRAEVEAGMKPGIGLGGSHLVRPQRSPQRSQLAYHRYGPARAPDVVLLHGLGASYAIWEPVGRRLGNLDRSVLVPDLLGFGRSRHIGTSFTVQDHVSALRRLLDAAGVHSALVVGHSFGCAVAAELGSTSPERVHGLVLVSPPAFADPDAARARLGERNWLARQVLRGTPAASVVCNAMCFARGAAARLTTRVASELPETVARDSVEHTWPSYRDAVTALLEDNPLPAAIDHPSRPTLVVLGDADRQAPAEDVLGLPHHAVQVEVWPSDHLVPLRASDRLADLIAGQVAAAGTPR